MINQYQKPKKQHKRQFLAALVYSSMMIGSQVFFCYIMLFPIIWPILIPYLLFMLFDKSPEHGARAIVWVRELPLWKWLAGYFSTKMIIESELSPKKSYIFGYHPHGIIATGAMIQFGTEGVNIGKILPGIKFHLLTLASNFYLPFYRELLLSLGIASVSKKSIVNILKKGEGNSVVVVVGGAQESLNASAESLDLVILKRFGFISLALKTGSDLVPVFCFGENNIYEMVRPKPGTLYNTFQVSLKKIFGFTAPIFYGRGFYKHYGVIPKQVPMVTVVGSPITVEKDENPSQEKVAELHKQYISALEDLYNRNKHAYSISKIPLSLNFT